MVYGIWYKVLWIQLKFLNWNHLIYRWNSRYKNIDDIIAIRSFPVIDIVEPSQDKDAILPM